MGTLEHPKITPDGRETDGLMLLMHKISHETGVGEPEAA